MKKEYLIKSEYGGYYSRGFISVEVVDQDTLDQLRKLVELNFSFYDYDVEGKHSENELTLDENDFVVISEDVDDISAFKKLFGNHLGNHYYSDFVLEKAYEEGIFDSENDEVSHDEG